MMKNPVIAVVGATGLVGSEMTAVLEQRKVPWGEVRLFASQDSVGEVYRVGADEVEVKALSDDSFAGVDIALFATSNELSRQYVPKAVQAGAYAIDNSSAFRMDEVVPLIVPEVNWSSLKPTDRLIANPNCSTIQLVPVLKLIHEAAGLRRVVVSSYQSVSGAGKAALDELWGQTLSIFNQRDLEIEEFPHQIAFNCIPQIDLIQDNGYTKEESKIINESRKILGLPSLRITATAVRVPVLHSHAESVNIETENPLSPEQCIEILSAGEGLSVSANPSDYPMQINVTGTDEIHVGRIRRDESVPNGLNMWIVADNIRKGAALNAVQIAERLIQQG